MTILEKSELINVSGGAYSVLGPNFKAYRKLVLWIYNTIKSWF